MSSIARTNATGKKGMLPELLAWSSSLGLDRALAREDLLGSAAHITMLARTRLVPVEDATALRAEILRMLADAFAGKLSLPDGEEDVHMAVESLLHERLGAVAGRLHTARSRNDQIALDLRLHIRDQAASALREISAFARYLGTRAEQDAAVLLPAYTHRQRAQPISAAFLMAAWAIQLLRAGEVVAFALEQSNVLPLGSGACSGTSLPIDRPLVAKLLGFPRLTANALDTVGERDFGLDWVWAAARVLLTLSRLSTDIIDFSTSEFGFVRLDDEIAAGSSMMPQKKNPDIFELVRAKSAHGIGSVTAMFTLVKGLPSGYNRDLQEDRSTLLLTAPLLRETLRAVLLALPHVHFVPDVCAAALAHGPTQATDLAEALVRRGLAFREAYRAVGALVRAAGDASVPLASVSVEFAQKVHSAFDAQALRTLDARAAVDAKKSAGGTSPDSVSAQLAAIHIQADALDKVAASISPLDALARRVESEPLEPAA